MSAQTFATDYTCIFQWLNSSFQTCVSVYTSLPAVLSFSLLWCYKWCLFSFLSKQLHIVNHEACCFNEFIYPCHLRSALIMSPDLAQLKQHLPADKTDDKRLQHGDHKKKVYEYPPKMVQNNLNAINHPGCQGSSSFHGPLEKQGGFLSASKRDLLSSFHSAETSASFLWRFDQLLMCIVAAPWFKVTPFFCWPLKSRWEKNR